MAHWMGACCCCCRCRWASYGPLCDSAFKHLRPHPPGPAPPPTLQELTARYGAEGAQAHAASLALPPGRPVRIRATREDVAAVRGLEAFSPGQEEPEDAGEAVPLGPAGGA
ncbi:hypothetical protein GPECTOR_141g689 [Gonium pectorale]|uniref:Uncharacterized protein n=1 Tax=Gonium pectorale TaxID=33097 RepID=A0A150FXZ5_GONPE|nr:hypothetical protein GPECTOR_141g689 [Gonium pectorale]|eukprot:KXZ42491.1 hypothetical protein GPECTOR_141g689 [Gonium pectorale]